MQVVTVTVGQPAQHERPRLDDIGNGERLARTFGHELKYAVDREQWLAWDGRRWKCDHLEAERKAKLVARQLYDEAATLSRAAANSEDAQNLGEVARAYLKWAKTSSSATGIGNMLTMARSESMISAPFHAFDRDSFAFNVENGTIELHTGTLRPHRQEDRITKLAPVIYEPQAVAPGWERFLERVLPDPELRAWVQRYMGYSLTGDVREQVLAFAYGNGANGKSVLLDVMLGIVGEYGHRSDPELLLAKQGETHQTGTADLEGKRIVVASEIEHNRAWGESMIKRITGDTTITARKMRMDFYTFNATHKLWIAANTKPKVHGTDNGIWRRMRLVPFEVTIPPEEQDKGLVAKLLATEASGILAWAVRGCLAWQAEGSPCRTRSRRRPRAIAPIKTCSGTGSRRSASWCPALGREPPSCTRTTGSGASAPVDMRCPAIACANGSWNGPGSPSTARPEHAGCAGSASRLIGRTINRAYAHDA